MTGLSLIVGNAQGSVQCDTVVSLGILRCSHPQALMRKLCIRYLGIYDYQWHTLGTVCSIPKKGS